MKVRITVYRVKTEEVEVEVDLPKIPKFAGTSVIDYAEFDKLAGTMAIEKVKANSEQIEFGTPVNVTYETGTAIVDSWEEVDKELDKS